MTDRKELQNLARICSADGWDVEIVYGTIGEDAGRIIGVRLSGIMHDAIDAAETLRWVAANIPVYSKGAAAAA